MAISLLFGTKLSADFFRFVLGTIQTPYQTFRKIAEREDIRYLPFIGGLVFIYLLLAGLAKGGLAAHPFLLTASFIKISSSILAMYLFASLVLTILGKLSGGEANLKRVLILWAFTLVPTSSWFIVVSLFSLLFPPPRTISMLGQIASAVVIGLSIGILLWKIILYYLTLRFGLRLDLPRIGLVTSAFIPIMGGYWWVMYRLGIFRVPFL